MDLTYNKAQHEMANCTCVIQSYQKACVVNVNHCRFFGGGMGSLLYRQVKISGFWESHTWKAGAVKTHFTTLSYYKIVQRKISNYIYYMTSSVSGQDEPNLMLWLATQVVKMDLSCLLRIQALSRKETFIMFWCFIPYNKSFIHQACLVKMAGYWRRSL